MTEIVLNHFSVQILETFGEIIRKLREEKKLPLRKVAAQLDIDPSTLSKIERNERVANRSCVKTLAELFDVEETMLLVHLLSDKVANELADEDCSKDVLRIAEKKIEYVREKNTIQSEIDFY